MGVLRALPPARRRPAHGHGRDPGAVRDGDRGAVRRPRRPLGRKSQILGTDANEEGLRIRRADVTLAGPAAQFGRTGLINEMGDWLLREASG